MISKASLNNLIDKILTLRGSWTIHSHSRKVILIFAFFLFAAGIIYSVNQQPDIFSNLAIFPLLIVFFLLIPISVTLMTWEFQSSTRLFGKNIRFQEAMETTIIASSANFLPLPGAIMVKIAKLKLLGITIKSSSILTALLALIWLSLSLIFSAFWISQVTIDFMDTALLSLILGGAGFVFLSLASFVLYKLFSNIKEILVLITLRFLMILNAAIRLLLVFYALNISAGFAIPAILTLARSFGAIIVFVPASLGITEIFSGLIAGLVNLLPSTGYMLAAIDRILDMAFLFISAIIITLLRRVIKTPENKLAPDENNKNHH